jgi:hypothetical protein
MSMSHPKNVDVKAKAKTQVGKALKTAVFAYSLKDLVGKEGYGAGGP